jgi:7,8-dihydroneopterin aldolase/epimerase/oxygenase
VIQVELIGLEVFGHHGVEPEEREEGQTFLFDVWFEVDEAVLSDRIDDAVDYRRVAEAIENVSKEHTFNLLETVAAAAADAVLARFPVDGVRVRVRKPTVGLPVEFSAATVERRR